ncbi:DUF4136 domain-containing protein [Pelagicoccus mobilis]|uniref:DUF4136 domain-containing protein n=1 Tax=Pelagicoccus mobilis TaxID=415221 RepID=A0A934S3U0_9BACT|nr:DUF4136 domain-containing protein [Pelagicoccus mobilis]MBK1880680.1 DUF4136 domain-containing protein [Pelagicoccus mobilis]
MRAKTIQTLISGLLLLALGLLTGCQTGPKISDELNPDTDFSAFQSFALLPLPKDIPGADPGAILRYGKAAQDGLRDALTGKGYTEAELAQADIAVHLKASLVPKIEITDWGYDYGYYGRRGYWGRGYPYSMGRDIDVDSYDEGTIVIELFDNKTKQLVWVGWATGRKKSKPMEQADLKALIAEIITTLPGNQ